MAIAYVKEVAHGTPTPAGTSLSGLAISAAPSAGNALILSFSSGSVSVSSVTDTKGNTWHVDITAANGTSETISVISTLQDVGTLTTSDTFTVNFSATTSTQVSYAMEEFSGLSNTVDQTASHTGSTTSLSAGTTSTTTNANDLIWAAWSIGGTVSTFTAGTGFSKPTTGFYSAGRSLAMEYEIVSATGAYNPTASYTTTAHSSAGVTVAYKAASSAIANTLTASPGSMAITGSAATPPVAHKPTASPGSYAITGSAVTPPVAHKPTASPGAYAITGSAATLPVKHKPTLSPGSIVINGAAATLTASTGVAYTLVVSAGAMAITGSSATLPVAKRLTISPASYSVTGRPVTPPVHRALVAGVDSMTISGASATLVGPGPPPTSPVIDNIQRPYGSLWTHPY